MKRTVVAIVYNPIAGSAAEYKLRILERELGRHGVLVKLYPTSAAPDSATQLAACAVASGVDAIIVAGGDGTVRQVATSLQNTGVALAAIPMGTGSVFAETVNRGIGESATYADFVGSFAAAVANAQSHPMDLIGFRCEDLCGVTHQGVAVIGIGIGDLSDAVVNTSRRSKRVLGKCAYLANIGLAAVRYREFNVTLATASDQRQEKLVSACMFNVLPHRLRSLSSGSKLDDGLLDFVGLRNGRTTGLLAASTHALLDREDRQGRFASIRSAQLTLEADRPMLLNLDGDAGPLTRKVELTALVGAVQLLNDSSSNQSGQMPWN